MAGVVNRSIAVFPLVNDDDAETSDGKRIAEELTSGLTKHGISVLERRLLDTILGELDRQQGPAFDQQKAQRVGKQVGAYAVVVGTITAQDKSRAKAYLRLVRVETGEQLCTAEHSFRLADSVADSGTARRIDTKASLRRPVGLEFDGRSNHIRTQLKYEGSYPLTLEALITVGGDGTIIGDKQAGGIVLEVANGHIQVCLTDGRSYQVVRSDAPVVTGRKMNVAGVYDKGKQSLRLYIDGLVQKRVVLTDGKYKPAQHPIMIGADPSPKNYAQFLFKGMIHAIRLSNSARYNTDFRPAESIEVDDNTILLYRFDREATGNIAVDMSRYGNNGQIIEPRWTYPIDTARR